MRILRAIRFAAKLNFSIEESALRAIEKHKTKLSQMPPARIYEEIIKLFLSGHAEKSYELLSKHQIFNILFPHSKYEIYSDKQQRIITLKQQSQQSSRNPQKMSL